MCSFGSFSKTLSKTREREKPKTRVSRRVSPRASCRLFHSLLNHGESEGIRMCVCLHPRRGRPTRSAKREAKRKKNNRAAPHEPPLPCSFRLVILFVSITDDVPSAPSRNETEGHGRISVERQRESRRSERLGRRAILLARPRKTKNPRDALVSSLAAGASECV